MTEKFETGDRVTVEINRGGRYDDNSIYRGGEWTTKSGVIAQASEHSIFIKFDDGDVQMTSNDRGKTTGFPARNVQPA